jgi:hypothetical protein
MDLKAALLATATAGVILLVAACGGDGGVSDRTPSQPDSSGGSGTPAQSHPATSGNVSSSIPSQFPPVGTGNTGGGLTARYVTIDLNCSACDRAGGSGIGDGEQVGFGFTPRNPERHILLWRGSASSVVDLGTAFEYAKAVATSGGVQVGSGGTDQFVHALKWSGSAGSMVDIHPGGMFRESEAYGIAGDQIIGYGISVNYIPSPYIHALLWTSAGIVDLNPAGYRGSVGLGTDGRQQVGYGAPTGSASGTGLGAAVGGNHALLWSGTAESAVDLHPVIGYDTTSANAVSGGQQVGWGGVLTSVGNPVWRHALLWTGSAESLVDLHPGVLRESEALAVAQGRQVGWGTSTDGLTHALLWNGTAESVVDLHVLLPPGFTWSRANGIDVLGNIIGSATDAQGISHAILWVPQ